MYYVIEGPATIGNVFGRYGHTLPAGKFTVVENGDYGNGGRGPSQVVKRLWDTREEAEAFLAERRREEAAT